MKPIGNILTNATKQSSPFANINVQSSQHQQPKRRNIVFRVLDVINSPGYGVVNAVKNLVDEEDFNPFLSFYKGLSLKEKTTFSEVLGELGWNPETKTGKVARGVLGFTGDVLLDPLTWTGKTLITKVSKALAAARKANKVKWVKNIGWADTVTGEAAKRFSYLDKYGKVKKGSDAYNLLIAKRAQYASGLFPEKAIGAIGEATLTFAGRPIPGTEVINKAMLSLRGGATKFRQFEGVKDAAGIFKKVLPKSGKAIDNISAIVENSTNVARKLDGIAKLFSNKMRLSGTSPVKHFENLLTQRAAEQLKRGALGYGKKVGTQLGEEVAKLKDNLKDGIKKFKAGEITEEAYKKNYGEAISFLADVRNGKVIDYLENGIPLSHMYKQNKGTVKLFQDTYDKLIKDYGLTHGKSKDGISYAARILNRKIDLKKIPVDIADDIRLVGGKFETQLLGIKLKGEAIGFPGINIDGILNERTGNVWSNLPVYKVKKTGEFWKNIFTPDTQIIKRGGRELAEFKGTLPNTKATGFWHIDIKTGDVFPYKQHHSSPIGKVDLAIKDLFRDKATDLGEFYNASIKQVNDGLGFNLFSRDALDAISQQAVKVQDTVALDDLIKGMTKNAGFQSNKHITHATKEASKKIGVKYDSRLVQVSDFSKHYFPDLKKTFFEPEIAKYIDKTIKTFYDPGTKNRFLGYFDKIQNVWKESATSLNAPFHGRNYLSNIYQNYLGGVWNPRHYKEALDIMPLGGTNWAKLSKKQQKIALEFEKANLTKTGWITGDIDLGSLHSLFEGGFQRKTDGVLGRLRDVVKPSKAAKGKGVIRRIREAGRGAGEWVEGQTKLAHYIAKREAGLSPMEAADSVRKYMFDYGDITKFEKEWMKRLIPFYTFSRKSIPMHLSALVKTPAKQTAIIKFKNNVEVMHGGDSHGHILPQYVSDNMPVFIGTKNGKKRYVTLAGLIPASDLRRLSTPNQAALSMLEMLSPILKSPVEQLLNYNFFFGTRITGEAKRDITKGWTTPERKFFNTMIGGRLDHLARLFRPLNELEKIVSIFNAKLGRGQTRHDFDEKITRSLIGSITYSEDPRTLLKRFDRVTKEKEANIMRQINYLRDEMKRSPLTREQNMNDIITLRKLLLKAKQSSRQERLEARKRILLF